MDIELIPIDEKNRRSRIAKIRGADMVEIPRSVAKRAEYQFCKESEKNLTACREIEKKKHTGISLDLGILCCFMALVMALLSLKICFLLLPITQELWIAFLEAVFCLASIIVGAIIGVLFALLFSYIAKKRRKKKQNLLNTKKSILMNKSSKYEQDIKEIRDACRRG